MASKILLSSLLFIIILVILVIIILFIINSFNSLRKNQENFKIPQKIESQGLEIPVAGTYNGFLKRRYNPFSISPLLKIYNNSFEYKVFLKGSRKYSEIKEVDIYNNPLIGIGTYNLKITFKDDKILVIFLINLDNYKELLRFFESKNITLSEQAKKFAVN